MPTKFPVSKVVTSCIAAAVMLAMLPSLGVSLVTGRKRLHLASRHAVGFLEFFIPL